MFVIRIFLFLLLISLNSFSEPEKSASKISHPFISGFLENKGQFKSTDGNSIPFVFAKANASGMDVYIQNKGISYVFHKCKKALPVNSSGKSRPSFNDKASETLYRIDANLRDASIKKENMEFLEENKQMHYNYFFNGTESIHVTEFNKIRIKEVYKGINWIIYFNQDGLKYDFEIAPHADYKQVQIVYSGALRLTKKTNGHLEIPTPLGVMEENEPVSYQNNREVPSEFILTDSVVSFSLKHFNPDLPVIIDPQLVWGTIYGGGGKDELTSLATDDNGNVFATGQTASSNFPLRYGLTYFDGTLGGQSDAFIIKFNNEGKLLWATFYGGKSDDGGKSIAIDHSGDIYVTGFTNSNDFPLKSTGTYYDSIFDGETDAFILKFTNNGDRLWATYYGGSQTTFSDGIDEGVAIAVDPYNNVFVTGHTHTADLPVQNAGTYFDDKVGGDSDAFILKFDEKGNRLWATYYGGESWEEASCITCDSKGNIYLTGYTNSAKFPVKSANTYFDDKKKGQSDVFISKFSNAGESLWATLYGGNDYDISGSLSIDNKSNLFVTGFTQSSDFPVQNAGTYFDNKLDGKSDAFILKFDEAGNRLWATYFGGSDQEIIGCTAYATAIDSCNNLYVGLQTWSNNIPSLDPGCTNYYDGTRGGGSGGDCFITTFSNSGILLWGSYIGDINSDDGLALVIDKKDQLFAAGAFDSFLPTTNLPLVNPGNGAYFSNLSGGGYNGFILKFTPVQPQIVITADTSSACCNADLTAMVDCSTALYDLLWNTGSTFTNIRELCAGTYTIKAVQKECPTQSLSQSFTVPFQEECNPEIPTIFTPNGDGINDLFIIKDLEKFPNSKIEIFSRWGIKVYENINYLNDWNGTDSKDSRPLISGVYFYILQRSDNVSSTGFVTIER